ncbi:MAG TPA: sigma-70 family RNA polymerase sigma factor [Polyangia bacterium]|nr:sigma-70 family RNA polymerase sigma factor [Polyangia bacterium]
MLGRLRLVQMVQVQTGGGENSHAAPPSRPEADRARLERMFLAHHVMVWRTMRRRGLTPDAAGDVTQQTFLVAAERLADINPDSERAFLVGTALRVAQSLGRKTVRWQLEDDMDQRVADAGSVSDARAAVQLCDLALSKVDSDLAEVFVMFELEGLSSPEIAASLEIPLGTVASRLRRAREQFRVVVSRLELTMRREGHA